MQERMFGHAEKVAGSLLKETDDLVAQKTFSEEPEQFKIERDAFVREISPLARIDDQMRDVEKKYGRELAKELEPVFQRTQSEYEGPTSDDVPPEDTLLRIVWERLCISLAEDVVHGKLVVAANRILQLSKLVMDVPPTPAHSCPRRS